MIGNTFECNGYLFNLTISNHFELANFFPEAAILLAAI